MKYSIFILALLPLHVWASFSDVSDSYPYFNAISYLEDQSIISGYADGTFRPADTINRAEFTKIVVESGFETATINRCNQNRFNDIAPNAWFKNYVCTAESAGLIEGYNDGSFKPANQILLGEAAKIMVEHFELNTTPTLTPWYEPYLDRLKRDNAIPASVGGADHPLNRGEMAELIYRLSINTANTPEPEITIKRGTESVKATDFNDNQTDKLLQLTNQARTANGLKPLNRNAQLDSVAQTFAQQMDNEDFFDHKSPDGKNAGQRVTQNGYQWRFVGENIAKGQVNAEYAFENWKNSSGHWANIINPNYKDIGLGQVKVTTDNRYRGYLWVQVFATQRQ